MLLGVASALILAFNVPTTKAATAGNIGSFVMSANGAVASISVEHVWCPWGGSITAYLKNSGGTTIATGAASGSFGDETVIMNFDEVMVYSGQTYSIQIVFNPVADGSYGDAYLTYTPYYLITVTSTYGSPTESAYVRAGNNYATSVTSPVSLGTGIQAQCTGYSVDGGSNTPGTSYQFLSVDADHTITYGWRIQYQVTYTAYGLDSSATGTVVTVDGAGKSFASLPYTQWVTSGGSTTFTYGSTVASSTTGKQFRLLSYSLSPQTITSVTNMTAYYTTQYYLTISTVNSSAVGAGWFDTGSTAYCSTAATTEYSGDTTRFVLTGWTGSGTGNYTGSNLIGTVTMNGPITQTATWQTQYYLSVVGIYSATTGSGWYNAGATASFDVTNPTISSGSDSQTGFTGWVGTGLGSNTTTIQAATCTMNAPITETAQWGTQYLLTIITPYGTASGGGWYTSGSTAYASLNTNIVSGTTGTRYVFSSWSNGGTTYTQSSAIVMNSAVTITASWTTQYYLTVTSAYGTASGANWYNVGSSATAGLNTNSVSVGNTTYTFQYWRQDATGSSYAASNAIVMTSPKTALAYWTGSTVTGTVNYTVTLHGPFYETGVVATDIVTCNLLYANQTIYSFIINGTSGTMQNVTVYSTTPLVQLAWNASSALNYTRIYNFMDSVADDEVNIYICDPNKASFQYTFSIADFYGMVNPYLEVDVSPDGTTYYAVERANLDNGGGYITFTLTQNQIYTLKFICDQGSYTQSFTAAILGTTGQYPVNLNVLAGNFPSTNATSVATVEATRLNSTTVSVTYYDPNATTTWVYISIYHVAGDGTEIVDYTANSTGSSQSFYWYSGIEGVDYKVDVQAYVSDNVMSWTVATSSSSSTNPWIGVFDFLGVHTDTLPQILSGWPAGLTSAQIAQLIGSGIIMLFLCLGSFRNAGASMIMAWIMAGIMLYLGWFQGGTVAAAIPEFALAGFLSIMIAIQEGKDTAREV